MIARVGDTGGGRLNLGNTCREFNFSSFNRGACATSQTVMYASLPYSDQDVERVICDSRTADSLFFSSKCVFFFYHFRPAWRCGSRSHSAWKCASRRAVPKPGQSAAGAGAEASLFAGPSLQPEVAKPRVAESYEPPTPPWPGEMRIVVARMTSEEFHR